MDDALLRRIIAHGELTRDALAAADPAAAAALDAAAAEDRRAAIAAALAGAPDEVQRVVATLDAGVLAGGEIGPMLRRLLARAGVDEAGQDRAVAALPATVAAPPPADRPLALDPLVRRRADTLMLGDLSAAAGLRPAAAAALATRIASPEALDDGRLDMLVADGVLTHDEADALGLQTGLYHLLGGNTAAAAAVAQTRFEVLGGAPAAVQDLLAAPAVEITRALAGVAPDPATAATMAGDLLARLADAYPNEAIGRATAAAADDLPVRLRLIAPLLRDGADPLGPGADAALADVDVPDRAAAGEALAAVRAVVRHYPGLDLGAIVGRARDPAAAAREIAARAALVDEVIRQNRPADLLAADLSPEGLARAPLRADGLGDDDKAAVLITLRARQRVQAVTRDPAATARLMAAGYHSAVAVAREGVAAVAAAAGLQPAVAAAAHARATDTLAGVSMTVGTIIDVLAGGFAGLAVGNLFEDVSDGLRAIAGFDALFGWFGACDCAHCSSILSPAAYFVDLMLFVEQSVLELDFTGAKAAHALNLKVRRPDLWTLPLTCANSDTLLPTLDIVNEVLESYLAHRLDASVDLADRNAVAQLVYAKTLAADTRSFTAPFVLAHEQASAYLALFDLDRAVLMRAAGLGGAPLAAAAIGLSPAEGAVVAQPRTDLAYLRDLFAADLTVRGSGFAPLDVAPLLAAIGGDRAEIGTAVASATVRAAAPGIAIEAQKSSKGSIQNDIERLTGASAAGLDALARFVRLRRRLDWTAEELDLLLAGRAATPVIDDAALADVALTVRLRQRFSLAADEAVALWAEVSRRAPDARTPALFERRFNSRPYAPAEGLLPDPQVHFVHPTFRVSATPLPANNTLPRLMLAMRVSEEVLGELIRLLAPALGADLLAGDDTQRGFALTAANLSLLYRHARLGALLRRTPAELGALLALADVADAVRSADDLTRLLAADDRLHAVGLRLDDLLYVTGSPAAGDAFRLDPAAITAALAEELAADGALLFADTVFAFVPGVTEAASRAIVAANPALFEAQPQDKLRLAPATPPLPAIATPAGSAAPAEALAAALSRYHAATILPTRIAGKLAIDLPRLEALVRLADIDLAQPTIIEALHGGALAPLAAAVATLARLATLFAAPRLTPARIDFVAAHRPLFALPDATQPAAASAERVAIYAHLLASADPAVADATAPDPAAVDAALAGFTPATRFAALPRGVLAAALGVAPGTAAAMDALVAGAPDALAGLLRLADLTRLSADSGIDGETIAALVTDDMAALARGAEGLVSALRRRVPEDDDFRARLAPAEDRLRGSKRDALVDHVLRHGEGRFATVDDLSSYFLVDVQYAGCATTSRVVAAISSVQTYVERVLLDLEQDRRAEGDAQHVHVPPGRIARLEWAWRKNYRVWEANRKVFLWPENYLEPELRDDKTLLFRALEDRLLQQDATEQNVLDAYADYMSGFEQLAGLKIAGAYHDTGDSDVLHVFGCTTDDPPVYYYWTVGNLLASRHDPTKRVTFSARERIDVAVGARQVSPFIHQGRLRLFWNEITTAPWNQVVDGGSKFIGYRHRVTTRFASLRLDGSWSTPQPIAMTAGETGWILPGFVVLDELEKWGNSQDVPTRSISRVPHHAPRDDYALRGVWWERVTPIGVASWLVLNAGGFLNTNVTDLFDRTQSSIPGYATDLIKSAWRDRPLLHIAGAEPHRALYRPMVITSSWFAMPPTSWQALVADEKIYGDFIQNMNFAAETVPTFFTQTGLDADQRGSPLATLTVSDVAPQAVVDSPGGALILQSPRDSAFVTSEGGTLDYWRLGTTVSREASRILFAGGIDALLATATQASLREDAAMLRKAGEAPPAPTPIDYNGAMGVYFREIFFHVPFLIADNLNERRNYAAAQAWYHYIFDPTAQLDPEIDLDKLDAAGKRRALRDRVWRYLPFRGLTPPTLRAILTDQQAIEAYRLDPFNPHAIARLRISAYQKAVVMKYIANLVDWGDSLFAQFTTEAVNEALTLYVLASEILGPPPPDVGDCGEGPVRPRTYTGIRPAIDAGSEFLIEMESRYWTAPGRPPRPAAGKRIGYVRSDTEIDWRRSAAAWQALGGAPGGRRSATGAPLPGDELAAFIAPPPDAALAGSRAAAAIARRDAAALAGEAAAPAAARTGFDANWRRTRAGGWASGKGGTTGIGRLVINDRIDEQGFGRGGGFGWSVVRQIGPAFCVPANKTLADLRARIDDRLFKIRHCRDINGDRRDLALFAPEIDPAMLVRARAAGLSMEEVLGGATGDLPPYRFTFLIERARSHAAAVQGFGAALMSAIEKRDAEELARLRNTQATNMLKLGRRQRESDLKLAEEGIAQVDRQRAAAEYRRDYYRGLIDTDLLSWERTQQRLRDAATGAYVIGSELQGTAGIAHLVPQIGSFFAMKYGGKETGDSLNRIGASLVAAAHQLESMGQSAGLEAGFQRRREGWEHQARLAEQELKQIERQATAAAIRRDIAARAIDQHQRAIDDQDEVSDLFATRFSNHALYTWLSTTLQRVYRQSFNGALAMARLAERAYRFERDDEAAVLLADDYWSGGQAGLLAGERLLADLNDLDRRFVETNYRALEIDQSFSLVQLDPAQLLRLRETGECDVVIPELAFDLFYPGQYRRRIRAVRLTIPCVVGPYVNIAATLTLQQSWLRREPKPGEAGLAEVPLRHSVAVATSSAQSDTGVFGFSFEDSRYMPFEGAGAVSRWTIMLPKAFRPFDYQTINDVVIGLSYTAAHDGAFRDQVETAKAALEGSISAAISDPARPLVRAVSLRQEQSSAFHRLLASPAGVAVQVDIDERILPFYLRGKTLTLQRALLLVRVGGGATGAGLQVRLNGQLLSVSDKTAEFGLHRVADAKVALGAFPIGRHTLAIEAVGDLASEKPDTSVLGPADVDRLLDLVIYLELTATGA